MLALTNNKLRWPYNSATTLDLGVLPQMANRVATCKKALNAFGPQAPYITYTVKTLVDLYGRLNVALVQCNARALLCRAYNLV